VEAAFEEMNESQSNSSSAASKILRFLLCLAGIVVGLFFLLIFTNLVFGPAFYRIVMVLPFGWLGFIARTFPNIGWNWDLVGMAVLSLALIGAGLNWLLRWLVAYIAERRGKHFAWPTRWTWSALVAAAIFFAVGMSVGGIVHQVGWIAGSKEPKLVVRNQARTDMMRLDNHVQFVFQEANDDMLSARERFWKNEVGYGRDTPELKRDYHIYVVTDKEGKYLSHIIKPRSNQVFLRYGGYTYGEDALGFKPASEIDKLLEQHRDHLVLF
jgi:hypothetical protein